MPYVDAEAVSDELEFELNMLAETAARIVKPIETSHGGVNDAATLADFDRAIWHELGAAGLLGLRFAPAHGGSEMSLSALAKVATSVARRAPGLPYLSSVILFGELLNSLGSEAQKSTWLPEIASGNRVGAVAAPPVLGTDQIELRIENSAAGPTLSGTSKMVVGGSQADILLVSALSAAGATEIYLLDPASQGVECRHLSTLDGLAIGDFTFDRVALGPDSRLDLGDPLDALTRTYHLASAVLCLEGAEIARALCEQTISHCATRVAFGKPLLGQQVIQHGIVDMRVATEHVDAAARRALASLAQAADSAAPVHAAKFLLERDGGFVAKQAVHYHGAIGTTEELEVGRLFRRMTTLGQLFGGRDAHLLSYAATIGDGGDTDAFAAVLGQLSPEEAAFRDEVRRFYEENLTPEFRRAGLLVRWAFSEFDAGARWQRVLHEKKGWGAPHWPVEFGGQDWTARQRIIFAVETMRARAPAPMSMGRDLCAPCIMAFGTDEQKDEFIPRILDGSDWWAQGYSEPQAGSDLAALGLRAERNGEHYILNGSKIWTTYAHHANRIFCLVRTARREKKQEGISFLLVDMNTPGITVRPIINLAGDHDFNEVFFEDVRVPQSRLLGPENEGWKVARHLLKFEHGGRVTVPMQLREWLAQIRRLITTRKADNPFFAARLAETAVDIDAIQAISWEAAARSQAGAPPSEFAELVNIRIREVNQRLTELMLDAVGPEAMIHRPKLLDVAQSLSHADDEVFQAMLSPLYYSQRAATIAGGTPEIHRNNLARKFTPARPA